MTTKVYSLRKHDSLKTSAIFPDGVKIEIKVSRSRLTIRHWATSRERLNSLGPVIDLTMIQVNRLTGTWGEQFDRIDSTLINSLSIEEFSQKI